MCCISSNCAVCAISAYGQKSLIKRRYSAKETYKRDDMSHCVVFRAILLCTSRTNTISRTARDAKQRVRHAVFCVHLYVWDTHFTWDVRHTVYVRHTLSRNCVTVCLTLLSCVRHATIQLLRETAQLAEIQNTTTWDTQFTLDTQLTIMRDTQFLSLHQTHTLCVSCKLCVSRNCVSQFTWGTQFTWDT